MENLVKLFNSLPHSINKNSLIKSVSWGEWLAKPTEAFEKALKINRVFDDKRYYEEYEDVKESGMDACFHYVNYGYKENRQFFIKMNYVDFGFYSRNYQKYYTTFFNYGNNIKFKFNNINMSSIEVKMTVRVIEKIKRDFIIGFMAYDKEDRITLSIEGYHFSLNYNLFYKFIEQHEYQKEQIIKLNLNDKIKYVEFYLININQNKICEICDINITGVNNEKNNDIFNLIDNFIKKEKLIIQYAACTQGFDMGDDIYPIRDITMCEAYTENEYNVIYIPIISKCDYYLKNDKLLQVNRKYLDYILNKIDAKMDIKVICCSYPTLESLNICAFCKMKGIKFIYEMRDDMEELTKGKWYDHALETYICQESDLIFVSSRQLKTKAKAMTNAKKKIFTVNNATGKKFYENSLFKINNINIIGKFVHKKIGCIGCGPPLWFDWELIVSIAKKMPDIEFEIIGNPYIPKHIEIPENFKLLGRIKYLDCINIAIEWRAGIIPFLKNKISIGVDPNKIYDYFALGLPCITRDISEINKYPYTYIYENEEEFGNCIQLLFRQYNIKKEIEVLTEFVKSHTWNNRAKDQINIMNKYL